MGTIFQLCEQLRALHPGARVWFWFNPAVPAPHPMLLLAPMGSDAALEQLRRDIRALSAGVPEQNHVGTVVVDAEGQLGLLCRDLDPSSLQRLAQWTLKNLQKYPELGRLRGAHIRPLNGDGSVDPPVVQPEVWQEVPHRPPRGTIAHAAGLIASLKPGERAWIWMIQCGPFGVPILCLSRCDTDPEMRSLRACIQTLMQGRRIPSPTARGVLRRGNSGGLSLLSSGDRGPMKAIVQTLVENYGEVLNALGSAVVLSLDGGAESAVPREQLTPDPVAVATGRILAQPGFRKSWFFFGYDVLGDPFLMLGEDRKILNASAQRIRGQGSKARGQIRLTKKGRMDFRTRDDLDDFIEGVAEWVRKHQRAVPELRRLRGARVLLLDDEGLIFAHRENDAVWG